MDISITIRVSFPIRIYPLFVNLFSLIQFLEEKKNIDGGKKVFQMIFDSSLKMD